MKKAIRLIVFTGILLIQQKKAAAQQGRLDSLFAKADTSAVMDSLMAGFDAYLDSLSQPKSFFTASIGMGNRTFSINNNSLNTQEATTRQLSFTPALVYYHKSGLGMGATGFLSNINNRLRFYQYAITPSYDYTGNKIAAGISYTRYFGKDSATLNASPYDNDLYAYFSIRRRTWRYGIAAGYATGNFSDNITYTDSVYRYSNVLQRYTWVHFSKTTEAVYHIKDFSLSASLRKDVSWYHLLTKNDIITVSLTAYLVTGTSKINSSTNINYATKKLTLARFRKSYSSTDGNNFQVQSGALSASVFYTIGSFNLQPVYFMDYYFQDADKKFSQVFSLTVGYSF